MRMSTAAAALVVAAVTGCSSSGSTPPSAGPSAPPTAAGAAAPNTAQAAALTAGLRKVNRSYGDHADRYVSRARNVCQKIQAGETGPKLVGYVREEFDVDGKPASRGAARKVISLVKQTFCK